jgi:hypothetical protein
VLVLWVWIVAVVLALVVLGAVAYSVTGAFTRLRREVEGARRDIQPVLEQLQATAARAEAVAARRANAGGRPASGRPKRGGSPDSPPAPA